MKKARMFFWLKTAGLLSALVVLLAGASSCKSRRHATKYGPPPADYNNTITKYGVPADMDNQIDLPPVKDTVNNTITKYGVPVDKTDYKPE
ncbi:MAG: hypothetical protein KA793_01025 [Bacteroidales bacterium]|nr:hypothetical protein [Bacteroidales bacterium]